MIRKVKTLTLAGLAALAVSAIGVSAAQAVPHFESPGVAGGVEISAAADGTAKNSHHVFDIFNESKSVTRSITCGSITANGETEAESQASVRVSFQYGGGCQFIGQAVVVNSGDCDYNFEADGDVQVVGENCAVGNEPITFETPNCKVEVGSQSLTGITYANVGSDVTLAANVSGISYNAEGSDCPFGSLSNGLYTTGNTLVKGDGGSTNIDWTE